MNSKEKLAEIKARFADTGWQMTNGKCSLTDKEVMQEFLECDTVSIEDVPFYYKSIWSLMCEGITTLNKEKYNLFYHLFLS
jgi:hypothetical protein